MSRQHFYTIDELLERVEHEPNDYYPEEPAILTAADEPAGRPAGGPRLLLTDEPQLREFFRQSKCSARDLYYRIFPKRSAFLSGLRKPIDWMPLLVVLVCTAIVALWPHIWAGIVWIFQAVR